MLFHVIFAQTNRCVFGWRQLSNKPILLLRLPTAHFAMQKFESQVSTVPAEANRYWWKVIVPALEFG